jgi:two-component system alkaline phosphatase synthesis response regulator PhoP
MDSTSENSKGLASLSGKKILIVEDDSFLHSLLADNMSLLRDKGLEVIPTFNGEDALKAARERKPDVVLLDIVLPGMNGFEVLEELKKDKELKDVPVIILSNLSQDEDIKRGKDLGADEFLVKANFTLDVLTEKIANVLEGKETT